MDEIDKKILDMLQEDGRASLKKIAEKTFLTSPAVSSRIAKLEKKAVITGYHAAVDPQKLGFPITAFVSLEVPPAKKTEFYRRMEARPNVLECNCVTGEYSVLLKVVFRTTMELDSFIGELKEYGKTSTQIVFSTPVSHRGLEAAAADDGVIMANY